MCLEMIGLDTAGLVIAGNRIEQPAALLQHFAAPVKGVHKPWIQCDGLVIVRQCVAGAAEFVVHACAAVISDRVADIERYGSVETLEGRLPSTEQLENEGNTAPPLADRSIDPRASPSH